VAQMAVRDVCTGWRKRGCGLIRLTPGPCHLSRHLSRRHAAQKIEQQLENTVRALGGVLVAGAGLDRTGQDTHYLQDKRASGSLAALGM